MNLMPVVAAALTDEDGRILVAQRPAGKEHAGQWEFPGGKVESGESPESALRRELQEELGVTIDLTAVEPLVFSSAPRGERHLLLLLYRCMAWEGEPRALDAAAVRWMLPEDMGALDMPPADRPFVSVLAAQRRG